MSATAGIGRRNSITTDVASSERARAADEEAGTDADHDREREPLEVRREGVSELARQRARPQLVDQAPGSVDDGVAMLVS